MHIGNTNCAFISRVEFVSITPYTVDQSVISDVKPIVVTKASGKGWSCRIEFACFQIVYRRLQMVYCRLQVQLVESVEGQ